jgi:hypothetical protein
MARYTPSFVNLSGATEALVNAYDRAAQIRLQQDQMMQAQIDDFQKNYNPNKLRDQDLPVFASAFKNYKEAALRYSRLNRSGAKPEEIAAASAIKDRTLNEMNDLYKKSTIASSREAEYTDWMKNARVRGYMVPDELAANYSALRNSSAKDIDVENIKSAWDYEFTPREVDIKDLTDAMDKIGGGLKEKKPTIVTGREYGQTAGGKKLYYDNIITMSGRNPNAVVTAINAKSIVNPAVHNAAKMSYDNFKQALSQNDQNAINKLNAIKQDFGVTDINNITPAMVYGYDFYAPIVTGVKEDKSRAEQMQQAENEAFDRSYKMQSLRNKNKGEVSFEHPSATINRVASGYESYTQPTSKNVEFTPKTGDRDVTREFSSYTLQNTMGGKTGLKNVLYNPGNVSTKTEPFVTYTTYDEPSVPKYTSLEQFNQLLVKASPDVTFKGGQKITPPKSSATTKSTKKASKGGRYVGIDAQGNPIFE